jgi:hypothetical protein
MAIPGLGYRLAADVLAEVSLHLVEPIVYCTILSIFPAGGGWGIGGWGNSGWGSSSSALIQPSSTTAMYPGAMIVIGWGLTTAEVVTIQNVLPNGYIFTTPFVNTHNAGEMILAPTFPTDQTTDPHFTQAEMLGYLARAENEMLADVPVNYTLSQQNMVYGQIFQNTPSNCIEINRVAASTYYCAITSITITSGVATVVTASPHGLQVDSTIFIQNPTAGFGGCYEIATVVSATSFTYETSAANGSATGGAILYFVRMYETTQAELTMANRTWRNDYVGTLQSWFEDRSGLYRFGVGGKPSSNFPIELLCSIRDTDTFGLLSGFLIPDVLIPTLKYKVLAFAWSKDGVAQDPARAAWCESRYQMGVLAIKRYLIGFQLMLKAGQDE